MSDPLSHVRGRLAAQCWYSARDYEEIKAGMEDGHRLPARHEDWLAGAEQREEQISAHGGTPVRVAFDLMEFKRFCAHFRVPLNSESRNKFAALKTQVDAQGSAGDAPGVH